MDIAIVSVYCSIMCSRYSIGADGVLEAAIPFPLGALDEATLTCQPTWGGLNISAGILA